MPLEDVQKYLTGGDLPRIAIAEGRCMKPPIGCGKEVSITDIALRDIPSAKEYVITGLCQECQDKIERLIWDRVDEHERKKGMSAFNKEAFDAITDDDCHQSV